MTKAALCVHCSDIVSPHRYWQADRLWRWCECDSVGVRWRDGERGLLEVTALHGPEGVRVIGINNQFLVAAVQTGSTMTADEWRVLHDASTEMVDPHYLFHKERRACWALVVRVGESGDVTFVPFPDAKGYTSGQAPSTE
jgi:hypothetical protein